MMTAKEIAIQALDDAYGRTQSTPDGLYCRIGRVNRAYKIIAQRNLMPDSANYKAAMATIKTMEDAANESFAAADKALSNYIRQCKQAKKENDVAAPVCDCPYCRVPYPPTINGVKLWVDKPFVEQDEAPTTLFVLPEKVKVY